MGSWRNNVQRCCPPGRRVLSAVGNSDDGKHENVPKGRGGQGWWSLSHFLWVFEPRLQLFSATCGRGVGVCVCAVSQMISLLCRCCGWDGALYAEGMVPGGLSCKLVSIDWFVKRCECFWLTGEVGVSAGPVIYRRC